MNNFGWIGVDFDGTLVEYERWLGPDVFGAPIPNMVQRVIDWLAEGREVRILTARVYAPQNDAGRQKDAAIALLAIQDWCESAFGQRLAVTCQKDFTMIEMWDDRAVQLIPNTGERADGKP